MSELSKWIEEHIDNLELLPWQKAMLEAHMDGKTLSVGFGCRAERRYTQDVCAAAAIACGQTVRFVAASQEEAEQARRRALRLLDKLDGRP